MPAPPPLTPEQRAAALVAATAARSSRAAMLAAIKGGELTLTEVLARAETDPVARHTRVTALFEVLPCTGPVKAARMLAELGISPTRRVGGLSPTQGAAITDRFL